MDSIKINLLRESLFQRLFKLFDLIPDATQDIWKMSTQKNFPTKSLVEIYNDLTLFLNSFPEYRRIILYIPFELLPGNNKSIDLELEHSARIFLKAYLMRWRELLQTADVGTNFTDGDVPEDYLLTESLPRTIKAVELVPLLIQKNILTQKQVQTLCIESDGLLNETLTRVLSYVRKSTSNDLFSSYELIENQFIIDGQNLTIARANWLRQTRIHALREKNALQLVDQIKSGSSSVDDLKKYLTVHSSPLVIQTGIIVLREYTKYLATTDPLSAQQLASSFTGLLTDLWQNTSYDYESKNLIRILVSHFAYLKVIPRNSSLLELTQTPFPSFAHFFTETKETSQLLSELRRLADTIEVDEVSQYVYPVIIAYGSQVKGYGSLDADIDIAVLIKPGTEFFKREYIHRRLKQILVHEKIKSLPIEFWVTDCNGSLTMRDYKSFSHPDNQIGDSLFIHILLQCPWVGNSEAIRLLKPVIHAIYTRNTIPVQRNLWAESLEHDIIQYRLLHKGYARLFPKQIPVTFSGVIDAESTFWDSGFRRLATLLYIKKVMVP